jgi:hypothetical protein
MSRVKLPQFIPCLKTEDFLRKQVKFGDKVRVGDPCYVPGEVSDDSYVEVPAVAGLWDCFVESLPKGSRIAAVVLEARASGLVASSRTFKLGVDSGQMAFESAEVERGGEHGEEGYYGDACRTTLAEDGYGVFQSNGQNVFVTSTGYGDGDYRLVIGFNEAGQAVKMQIEFIEEDEEDEEETCSRCGDSLDWCSCQDEEDEEDEEE